MPEPVRRPLEDEQEYFVADVVSENFTRSFFWDDDDADNDMLKAGIIHLTREAAEAHAKALLSFTEKQP